MELQRLCAYNQTRECFLGLEVASADLSVADLENLLGKLALKSGEGLWMDPFRGIPETNMRTPLDLIYLDEESRVIEVVESFPTFHLTSFSSQAASVLALPAHSIYSSQTQSGDQLVLCMAEEMQSRLERFSGSSGGSAGAQSAAILRGKSLWSAGPRLVQLEDRYGEQSRQTDFALQTEQDLPVEQRFPTEQNLPAEQSFQTELSLPAETPHQLNFVDPESEDVKPRKGWLERWWSPEPKKALDPRKAPREPSYGLAAYYWTGAAPTAHAIRDISSTGMYILTEERWYPGTLILMTLQDADSGDNGVEGSISVHSRVVRWGADGVGLQFVPQDDPSAHDGLKPLVVER